MASPFVLSTLVPDTHRHTYAHAYGQLLIIIVTVPGEKEVTHSSQWGLGMVVKVNEADGSGLKWSLKKKKRKKKW